MKNVHLSNELTAADFVKALERCGLRIDNRLILSVSGGLDSMTLWHLVRAAHLPHIVTHVNFGLRGGDSTADAALVRETARAHAIPAHILDNPLPVPPTNASRGVQTRARETRIRLTTSLSQRLDDAPIVLAHHADDQAETILMRLARGTGGAGLAGMAPASYPFYRPLLGFTRGQLAAYAKTHGVAFRHDRSNDGDVYTRNAFRHHMLPALLKAEPRAIAGLERSAEQQADLVSFARGASRVTMAAAVLARAPPASVNTVDGEPVYDRTALARTPGLSTLLYFWLHDGGYRSAQLTELAAWISDERPGRRRMPHPSGTEAVFVTGRKVYRGLVPPS